MSDTMTLYENGQETVIPIDPTPDPKYKGKFLIKNENNDPLRCALSLQDHSYHIWLPPGSYVIIAADSTEMFKEASSDDRVVFMLPTSNAADFYVEQYFANMNDTSPHKVLALRYHERSRIISAALYPRDLEHVPRPIFVGADGMEVSIVIKGIPSDDAEGKVEYAHYPNEIELIRNAIFKPADANTTMVDPNAPKEEWF